jgi:hypothetical protein
MADVKISGLPASTTPLAGTEVLPIVQGTTTKKVAVSDLTAGRAVATGVVTATNVAASQGVLTGWSPTGGANAANGSLDLGTSAGNKGIVSYDSTGAFPGALYLENTYNDGGASIRLRTRTVDRIIVQGNGDVSLATGNLVIGTSGKGIDFSATAGTGTSELLNDYEEGTWTPTYSGDGGNPTVTYSTRSGTYTKVGRVVTITCSLVIATVSGGSGQLRIAGLPFTNGASNCGLSNGFVFNFFLASPQQYVVSAGLDSISLYQSSFTNTVSTTADLQASAFLFISGSYVV